MRLCAVMLVVLVALGGCSSSGQRSADSSVTIGPGELTPPEIQSIVMAFAESSSGRLNQPLDELYERTTSPFERLQIYGVKLGVYANAVEIASSSNPVVAMVDMTVMTYLVAETMEPYMAPIFGDRASEVIAAAQRNKEEILEYAAQVLTPEELSDLLVIIDEWQVQNPDEMYVTEIRLTDFAEARQITPESVKGRRGSVFRLMYMDPLANLDPAVRELNQSRLLAERAFWYGQRVPVLIRLQARVLYLEYLNTPETQGVLANINRYADVFERFAAVAEALPDDVSRVQTDAIDHTFESFRQERQAVMQEAFDHLAEERSRAIEQMAEAVSTEREAIIRSLDAEREDVAQILQELRSTMEAGRELSDSLTGTITALDSMVKAMEASRLESGAAKMEMDDITAALMAGTTTADEATELVDRIEALLTSEAWQKRGSDLGQVAESFELSGSRLIRQAQWSGLMLVVTLVVGIAAGLLIYRVASVTIERRRPKGQS